MDTPATEPVRSVALADAGELAPGQMRSFELGRVRVLLCNAEGQLYALEDRCSHARFPLHGGKLRGCILECPVHGARFDVRDGRPTAPPARRPVQTFPVRRAGDRIEVEIPESLLQEAGG